MPRAGAAGFNFATPVDTPKNLDIPLNTLPGEGLDLGITRLGGGGGVYNAPPPLT